LIVTLKGEIISSGYQKLEAPLDYINLHLRGGYIIPIQNPQGALNTRERYILNFFTGVLYSFFIMVI
jgi:hypothetical protein